MLQSFNISLYVGLIELSDKAVSYLLFQGVHEEGCYYQVACVQNTHICAVYFGCNAINPTQVF